MASIIKDIRDIWTRLFDHRPFIQGEINFFLREFQDRRSDREVECLFKIAEYSTDIEQSQIDRAVKLGISEVPNLKANINVLLDMCKRVLQTEEKSVKKNQLNENKNFRKLEWEKFINDTQDRYQKINEDYAKKENDLRNHYLNLEKQLHITQ